MNLQWERYKKTHPGTNAPPGTTWRVDGGDKINQALQEKGCESSSGSVQAVTRVNVEQASKRAMRTQPVDFGRRLASRGQDPGPGKQDTTSETSPKGV